VSQAWLVWPALRELQASVASAVLRESLALVELLFLRLRRWDSI